MHIRCANVPHHLESVTALPCKTHPTFSAYDVLSDECHMLRHSVQALCVHLL